MPKKINNWLQAVLPDRSAVSINPDYIEAISVINNIDDGDFSLIASVNGNLYTLSYGSYNDCFSKLNSILTYSDINTININML